MVQKLIVDPKEVWSFYRHLGRSVRKNLLDHIDRHGWKDIPAVPVFKIPNSDFYLKQHNYMSMDGDGRLQVAEYLNSKIEILIFNPDEHIDVSILGLAKSKVLTDPSRFTRLLHGYAVRDKLSK